MLSFKILLASFMAANGQDKICAKMPDEDWPATATAAQVACAAEGTLTANRAGTEAWGKIFDDAGVDCSNTALLTCIADRCKNKDGTPNLDDDDCDDDDKCAWYIKKVKKDCLDELNESDSDDDGVRGNKDDDSDSDDDSYRLDDDYMTDAELLG